MSLFVCHCESCEWRYPKLHPRWLDNSLTLANLTKASRQVAFLCTTITLDVSKVFAGHLCSLILWCGSLGTVVFILVYGLVTRLPYTFSSGWSQYLNTQRGSTCRANIKFLYEIGSWTKGYRIRLYVCPGII